MRFCNLTAPAPKQQINAVHANKYTHPILKKNRHGFFSCIVHYALL